MTKIVNLESARKKRLADADRIADALAEDEPDALDEYMDQYSADFVQAFIHYESGLVPQDVADEPGVAILLELLWDIHNGRKDFYDDE